MEVALLDLRHEVEVQESHVKEWERALKKEIKGSSGRAADDLAKAKAAVQALRDKCQAIESSRPPRLPSPPPSREAAAMRTPAQHREPEVATGSLPSRIPEETARRSDARAALPPRAAPAGP